MYLVDGGTTVAARPSPGKPPGTGAPSLGAARSGPGAFDGLRWPGPPMTAQTMLCHYIHGLARTSTAPTPLILFWNIKLQI